MLVYFDLTYCNKSRAIVVDFNLRRIKKHEIKVNLSPEFELLILLYLQPPQNPSHIDFISLCHVSSLLWT